MNPASVPGQSGDVRITDDIPISNVDSPSVVLELIYELKIKDVMNTAVITIGKNDTMRRAQTMMRENRITGLPVTEGSDLVGIVSIEDLIRALDEGCIDSKVEERMTGKVTVLEDDMPLSFAISYMNKYSFGRFPVLNKNRELVGIISSKDVINTLLVKMNREVLRLEKMNRNPANTPEKPDEMNFTVNRHDFEHAGRASTEIKKALKARNIDSAIIRRIAIASYELEINLVVHSVGGVVACSIQPDRVIIEAADKGPGIPNLKLALQEGWSTADDWIRSLGFGAGMGLANTKRVSDEFFIKSEVGTGTVVRSVVLLP
ncbi:MAG: CBS domain-containing protein [Treponema sp.]|nr:CBS domain-containing protein [Treponema sp.]